MSIFSSLQPEAHLNHNVFDLSRRSVLSAKVGMGLPVFVQHTIPNASYDIKVVDQVEVAGGMQAANFARISQQIEYYFVPYTQLWKHFDSFYYQRSDDQRNPVNSDTSVVPQYCPTFALHDLLSSLKLVYLLGEFMQAARYSSVANYKYGSPLGSYVSDHDFYLEISGLSEASWLLHNDVHQHFVGLDQIRLLDLLGYGNYLPAYKEALDSYLSTISKSSLTEVIDDYFESQEEPDMATLFATVLSSYTIIFEGQDLYINVIDPQSTFVTAWPILAYLKIFSDNFRSVQYDDFNYSYYFNYDWLVNPTSEDISLEKILFCLKPWYKLYKRDIFTGTYPNAQFGDVSVASLQNPTSITVGTTGTSSRSLLVPTGSSKVQVGSSGALPIDNDFYINSGVSALAIRQAEALQRYKEKNLRAGNRLPNQQKAFFGDRSRFMMDDYVDSFGSCKSPVIVKDVTASAESDGVNLGDKGATASSSQVNSIPRFVSHDFGVIIGILYFYPETEYEAYGIDPMATKIEKFDFYNSDFQNLGLAPVNSKYYNIIASDPDGSVLGYSSRYWEYKTAIDKVHGEFNKGGVFNIYVTPRGEYDFTQQRLSSLYVSPNDVDRIFYFSADARQSTDQFIVNMYHEVKAILPMSVTGLPY